MALTQSRSKVQSMISEGKDLTDEEAFISQLEAWFRDYKAWEADETFERAFRENRMTVRVAPVDAKDAFQTKHTVTPDGAKGSVKLRAQIEAIPDMLNPNNFLEKHKNDMGLFDVSAVLLDHRQSISKQVFSKVGRQPYFMPIPEEEDLQLMYMLAMIARRHPTGKVRSFYVTARAQMTRIKYGSDEDMKTAFLRIPVEGGADKIRYGDAHETAGPVAASVLRERKINALHYKSRVLTGKRTDNNEVTLKVRHHAGGFPWAAVPGPMEKSASMPVKIPAGEYLVASIHPPKIKGFVTNEGRFRPMTV